jgi:hypothetical protein
MENSTQSYGQMDFTLPHDIVKLPSNGIFYKSKKKSLKVGYLTASDENLLLADNQNTYNLITTLLRNKIYEPDVKPEDLLEGDIQAILIFLRNTAFGPEYNISTVDTETNKVFDTTVLLDELFIRQPEIAPEDDGYFNITLPKSGIKAKIKPLTYGEILEIENMADKYPVGRVAPKQTWKLNKMILEMNDSSDRGEISKIVESLPISDAKYIRKFIENNEPKLDLVKKIITPSGKETTVNFGLGVEFFRPFF